MKWSRPLTTNVLMVLRNTQPALGGLNCHIVTQRPTQTSNLVHYSTSHLVDLVHVFILIQVNSMCYSLIQYIKAVYILISIGQLPM